MTEQDALGSVRSRTTTWCDPAAAAAARAGMSGREYVEGLAGGQVPPPPMASLLGFRVIEAGEGEVLVVCAPEEAFYNPIGIVHGGLLCTLLDTAMGLAVQTLMPPGASFSTIEIKVNFLKAVRAGDGDLAARGRVTKRGSRVTFTEAEVRDPGGSLVGTATSSLLVHDPSPSARPRRQGDDAGTHPAS
jgi:uncharacterized protein (TIGR00369 family)